MQSRLPMHLPPLRRPNEERDAVPITAMTGKSRCRMHGGASPGAPLGNSNARKHGH